MLTATEERLLKYIEDRARENVKGKTFFKMTDVLEDAFLISKERSYEVLKYIVANKNTGNSKNDIIREYIDMLKKGYGSIQEQVEVFGGDKLSAVIHTAERRLRKYEGGTFFDVLRDVYNIPDEEIIKVIEKYLEFLNSPSFVFRLEKETFHRFLQSNLEELDKQFDRFVKV
jgi:predicted nucleic-acid-binding protein